VEGREHGEFELELVAGDGSEGCVMGEGVFGELDLECLEDNMLAICSMGSKRARTYHVVFDPVDCRV
jgi:hypothetical protein